MYDIILKNCSIVNENQIKESDIAIKNQRIELISTSIDSEARKVIDLNGRYVIPGLIDDQVHFRDPGLTHKGDIATESKAGLAGGVTSFFEMPNVNPTTTTNENLTKKFELASTKALSENDVNIQIICTSEIKITMVIDEALVDKAVNVLHEEFELEK